MSTSPSLPPSEIPELEASPSASPARREYRREEWEWDSSTPTINGFDMEVAIISGTRRAESHEHHDDQCNQDVTRQYRHALMDLGHQLRVGSRDRAHRTSSKFNFVILPA
ncbi:hypothetical protein B0H11DRAFT_1913012 [Mycena galericulata]|nr:hypothetical protein B0H11DRAFT_1913012 [Mycena galericulata]